MKLGGVYSFVLAALTTSTLLAASNATGGGVSRDLERELQKRSATDEIAVIVTFSGRLHPSAFRDKDKHARRARMERAFKDKAEREQKHARGFALRKGGKRVKQLWINNELAVTLRAEDLAELARQPGVANVRLDAVVLAAEPPGSGDAVAEWNLHALHVPEMWALGHTGAGVVVATMDSGVDDAHPDLAGKWRGGGNSWFDPHGEHATPYDANGHGTQVAGILLGGNTSGAAIGVAPDARWIATKIYNDAGQAQYSDIHQSFQWLLDPDGNPDSADAPDVVNASWGLLGSAGQCVTEFANDIQALKAAGIAVVFAGGNDGPDQNSGESPATNPGGFSVGAVDGTQTVAAFSSRGASACDGGIFPKITAPGVDINTTDLSFGGLPLYATVTGTSFATPHVSGAMALLLSAFPQTSVETLEAALTQSALDLGAGGADNDYGYGLADVLAAHDYLAANQPVGNDPPTITSMPVTTATEGVAYAYQMVATDPDGDLLRYALDAAPTGMNIDAATGMLAWTPDVTFGGTTVNVVVRATDPGGLFATQAFSIAVAGVAHPPVAANDAYSTNAGKTLSVATPGVLANDGDPDGDPLNAILVNGPAHGTLLLRGDGSFSYTPQADFAGTDSFSYRAGDGVLPSEVATVTITVLANQPPVAANDNATTKKNRAVTIKVLANDTDADGTLVRASVSIASPPALGGSVFVNANGTVRFTPKTNFVGTDTFSYTVKDNKGALSNVATVTVNVK